MKKLSINGRLAALLALLVILSAASAHESQGQARRGEQTLYLRPHVGLSSYVGDNDKAAISFDGAFPYSAGIELGYQFTVPLSVGVGYQIGSYPGITIFGEEDTRHSARLLLRYLFGGETGLAPYIQVGGHATFGNVQAVGAAEEEQKTSFGPLFGLGLDVPLSGRVSFFLEANSQAAFPDDAVDGRDDNGSGGFDLLSTLGAGLKINFKSGFVPVDVQAIRGPARIQANDPGTFTALVDEKATGPIEYRWDWGDGNMSTGLTATHTYAAAGNYTITFTGSNRGSTDSETMAITVTPPPMPARIVSISADPNNPDTGTLVRFSANIEGDTPLSYNWDFGDGSAGSGATPTHTYTEPGTYTVTLNASNTAGADTRTMTLTVRPSEAAICSEIFEMNAVYFQANSSTLTAEGERSLRENLEILEECSSLDARIEGFAAPGERNPQRLSEDRARAVEQFYLSNGVSADRLNAIGRGRVVGMTSKKEGASQYRRVDTIPVR